MSILRTEAARAYKPLLAPARYKGAHGGRGSGKSHFFAEQAVKRCVAIPGTRIVCVREVQKSLKESVKLLIEDKIGRLGVADHFRILDKDIRTPGGGLILFQGMQDHTAESIKSLEGFDVGYVEEAQTMTARSLEMLRPTIRKPGSELWFSWNPRHASDPVDSLLRGIAPPPGAAVVQANYVDNPWFPPELEDERAFDEQHAPHRYGHIWLGEYEPAAAGAIWDRLTIHQCRVAEAPPMRRILVSIDPAGSSEKGANETGIVACGLGEDGRGYVLEDASLVGTPEQWARQSIAVYDMLSADAIVAETNYGGEMVINTIRAIRPEVKVIEVRATRGKHVRAEPISALYSLGKVSHVGAFPELESQMCLMTAAGFEGEGSPDRCLAAGTLVETARGATPIERVTCGDMVLTRVGYRRVIAAQRTGENVAVRRVALSSGRSLVGTGNHPVFVAGRGFMRLDALARDDILFPCAERSSYSRAESTFATLIRRIVRPAFTSITRLAGGAATAAERCTGTFGSVRTGQSRPAISSITRTRIRSTIAPTISNASPMRSTPNGIRKPSMISGLGWIMLALTRALGTAAMRALNFIGSLAPPAGLTGSPSLAFAMNAAGDTRRFPIGATSGFAACLAAIGGGRKTEPTMRSASAPDAASRSWRSGQRISAPAPVSVVGSSDAGRADVYNLTVDGENEYFASGILVHNCDALVWGFTELFPKLTPKSGQMNRVLPTTANNVYRPHRWHS